MPNIYGEIAMKSILLFVNDDQGLKADWSQRWWSHINSMKAWPASRPPTFREAVLGGVSRDMLAHSTVPLLLAH